MKFIKKSLLKIPVEDCPKCSNLPKDAQLIMTAKVVAYSGEQLLVATFYRSAAERGRKRAPFLRIFCTKEKHINYHFEGKKWSYSGINKLNLPGKTRWYDNLTTRGAVFIADEASAVAGGEYFGADYAQQNTLEAMLASQNNIRLAKMAVRNASDKEITARVMAGFPDMPQDVEQAVLDGPLRYSRYLFYRRGKRFNPLEGRNEPAYYGYCTHCHQESVLDFAPKHNADGRCPACASCITVKARGISRTKLVDSCYYLVFSKDAQGAVYARYLYVERDYRYEPEQAETLYCEWARFYFAKGEAHKFEPITENWINPRIKGWKRLQKVTEPVKVLVFGSARDYYIHPFPAGFFDSTDLRHSHFEDYLKAAANSKRPEYYLTIGDHRQMPMEYLALYCKYPSVEHLLDSGLYYLLEDKLRRCTDTGKIKLKHSRPRDMLGVSQPELKMIVEKRMDMQEIELYKEYKTKLARPMDAEDIAIIRSGQTYIGYLRTIEADWGAQRVFVYLKRQHRRTRKDYSSLLIAWRDYLGECAELLYDTQQEHIAMPHDLKKAHHVTMTLVRQKHAEEARLKKEAEQKLYAERIKNLELYSYTSEDAGLLIRAARSRQELVDEGAALSHCVGRYADEHLKGATTIFFIRHIETPEESYFTLEFKGGKINQNRGKRNCAPPDAVKRFAQQWLETIAAPLWEKEKRAAKRAKESQRVRVQNAVA